MTELKFENFLIERKTKVGNRKIPPYSITNLGLYARDEKYTSELSDDYSKNKVIEKGNLAFGNSRNILNYGVMSDSIGCVSNVYKVFEVDNNIVRSNYIDLYFYYNRHNLKHLIKPGSRDNLPIDVDLMLNERLKIPSLSIQDYVINLSETIKLVINQRNEINSNLEELAQTLYKRWFLDFEFPNEEGKPYKSSGGEMVESELGLIPKGWEVKSLREIMDFQGGFAFKGNRDNLDLKYKIITIKNVQDGYMNLSVVSSIDHKPNKLKESQVLQIGDILVSLTGNVGRTCIVNQENCLLNQRVEKVSPFDTELQGFTYFLFRSSQINSVMQSLSKGSAQQNLSPVELSNQKIAIPNELAAKFDVFNSLFQSVLNNQIQNMSLTKTRDLLLPKLMSGEIEV